ncbi:MAG: Asp/Glu racemase [Microlunatus sp.]|nr:Asp/Glu racemase [Microlunatus sp.]
MTLHTPTVSRTQQARREQQGPRVQKGVGVIVPYDMALDRELWRWTPPEVDLFLTRTPRRPFDVGVEMARAVSEATDLAQSVVDLSAVSPDVYAYGCASGSFIHGLEGERRLAETMSAAGAAPVVTASGAMLEAVRAVGATRLSVVTPYTVDLTSALATYFEQAGVEVVAQGQLGLTREVWRVPARPVAELIRSVNHPDAEAVVVSCTNLHTYDLIPALEVELGKPVISANQALLWSALRRISSRAVGQGQHLVAR